MRAAVALTLAVLLGGCAATKPSPWVLWRETFMVSANGKHVMPGTVAAPVKTFDSLWACADDAERSTFAATAFVPTPPVTITPVRRYQIDGGWQWAAERTDLEDHVIVQGFRCLPQGIVWPGMDARMSDFVAQ